MPADWRRRVSTLSKTAAAPLEAYEAEQVTTWRRSGFWTTSLRGLELDALEPKRYSPWTSFPRSCARTWATRSTPR